MNVLDAIAEKVRTGAPLPTPIAVALAAATPLTRLGMAIRRFRKTVKVQARVISFGNITAGGTGKTPAVIERVTREIAAGHRVAVLTRGYGAAPAPTTVALLGAEAALQPERVGDEPALIGKHAPESYIVRDADRVRGARVAVGELGCDTLVLDDGFQSVRLARDEDIVLVDATNAFGNGRLIPRGILREPMTALRRATRIVLTRCDQVDSTPSLIQQLEAVAPGVPVRTTRHAPVGLWNTATEERLPLDALRGRDVVAVSAIGRPEAFRKTLEQLGARVVETHAFRDHGPIDPSRIDGSFVVTTEKDAIRMKHGPAHWWALSVALEDWP